MESQGIISEEIVLPERVGVLSSESYQSINGKIVKTIRRAFCDSCTCQLDDDKPIVLCNICKNKLCSSHSCSFEYERKHYCGEHIQHILPLSVCEFEILGCMLSGIDPWKACELAHMTRDSFKEALNQLLEAGYVERRGISLFATYRLLDRGILAWKTYGNAYRHDGSVAHFELELADYLQEKEMKACLPERPLRKQLTPR